MSAIHTFVLKHTWVSLAEHRAQGLLLTICGECAYIRIDTVLYFLRGTPILREGPTEETSNRTEVRQKEGADLVDGSHSLTGVP